MKAGKPKETVAKNPMAPRSSANRKSLGMAFPSLWTFPTKQELDSMKGYFPSLSYSAGGLSATFQ